MQKGELEDRCREMKARVLAHRTAVSQGSTKARPLKTRVVEESLSPEMETIDKIAALKKEIARLQTENRALRDRLASQSAMVAQTSRSSEDAVREQRHNFFKYSNARRY